jgi:ABC-type glycerol-3-phosphate transport system substrate-binding protein
MNTKPLSRRTFLQMTALTAAGATLAACTAPIAPVAGGGAAAAPGQTTSLKFWMWNTFAPDADEVMQAALNDWAKANSVTLEISRDADNTMPDKIMPAIEAGTLPDALFVDSGMALRMIDSDAVASLKDVFAEVGEAHKGWLPRLDGYVTRDGDIKFLPYSIDTPMLQFRQDLIEKAGGKVPDGQWTWDQARDLGKLAQDYTEKQGDKKSAWGFGVVKQQTDGWCEDLFRNFAADIWDESGTKVILAEKSMDNAVRALNFIKDGWDAGLFPADAASWDYSSNNKNYEEEQGVMVINAASIYVWCQQNKPELADVTGLAPKPKETRDTTDCGLRYTLDLNKSTNEAPKATQLIKDLYSTAIYQPWLEKGFVTNVVHEYDTLPMWTGKRAAFNLAANIGVYGGYPAPYDNAAMAELFGPNAPIGSMVVRVLIDNWKPEDAVTEADTFAKQVFSKYFQ